MLFLIEVFLSLVIFLSLFMFNINFLFILFDKNSPNRELSSKIKGNNWHRKGNKTRLCSVEFELH